MKTQREIIIEIKALEEKLDSYSKTQNFGVSETTIIILTNRLNTLQWVLGF